MKTKTVRKPAKAPAKTTSKTPAKASVKKTAKAPRKTDPTLKLLKAIVEVLDAKKAENLKVLDVSKQSSITDYLILANGNSEPHLRALRVELEKVLDSMQARILGMDTGQGSGWTVVDAFEVMIHLFTTENRGVYRLDSLWKDATEIPLSKLLK
jgi:ribosome-associated protein